MNVDLSHTPMNIHYKSCGDQTYNTQLNQMVDEGRVSLRGLKADSKIFDEMIFDVNTAYFEEHGGYEFARRFYEEVFHFAEKEYGPENIVSAVMHADELNTALTEQLGHPVYHYHLHVVALPVVDKEIRWSKRCKNPELVGTVKEVVHQISHSKKWASQKVTGENGKTQLIKSYSLLQDRFFDHMREAGFEDFERGERGSTAQHLSALEYKSKKEAERIESLQETAERVEEHIDLLSQQESAAARKAEAAQARIERLAPKAKNIEELARKYTADADELLPQAGALETARAYRKNKAIPLYRKIISVLRSLFGKYLDLKWHFEQLQTQYNRNVENTEYLEAKIKSLAEEKSGLSAIAERYHALCRGYGADYIESHAVGILEKEKAERQQKKPNHTHPGRNVSTR